MKPRLLCPPGPVLNGLDRHSACSPLSPLGKREAPHLVRSTYVGEVLGNCGKVLLIHHEGQDLFMYPQLAERAPASASHEEQMLQQHGEVKAGWRTSDPCAGAGCSLQRQALGTNSQKATKTFSPFSTSICAGRSPR